MERRRDAGLSYDPAQGRLCLGDASVTLTPGVGNKPVLCAYVELAAHARGGPVTEVVAVRQDDLTALASALDLDAADLAAQVADVLGANRADAAATVERLRTARVIGGITEAAIRP